MPNLQVCADRDQRSQKVKHVENLQLSRRTDTLRQQHLRLRHLVKSQPTGAFSEDCHAEVLTELCCARPAPQRPAHHAHRDQQAPHPQIIGCWYEEEAGPPRGPASSGKPAGLLHVIRVCSDMFCVTGSRSKCRSAMLAWHCSVPG